MGTSKRAYTTTDIARLGTKRERLKEWMLRGYIKASIESANGAGTKNLFSRWDLYMIQLFQYLVERGFSREDTARRIRWLFLVGEIADEVISSSKKISEKNRKAALESYDRFLTARFLILPKRGQGIDGFPRAERIANRDGSFEEPPSVVCIVKEENGSFMEYAPNGKKRSFSFDNYRHHDDILLVNFKKIRDKVDELIE
jgi:hypothetical protein